MAAPMTPQPMPYRAWLKQLKGALRPFAHGSMLDAGTRQSANETLEVTETRIESFPCRSEALKPGVPFSTRNPRMPSSLRAHAIAISAIDPFVILPFSPLGIQ